MIFSSKPRNDYECRKNTEPLFQYLDRSARNETWKVRLLIESWYSQLPEEAQNNLIQRLKSDNDHEFHSAFLEVFAHELLQSTGHKVILHPKIKGSSKQPDFMAIDSFKNEYILECTVATEVSDDMRKANNRYNRLLDSINDLDHSDFFLDVCNDGFPNSSVPFSRWQLEIQQWLDSLNYEDMLKLGPLQHDDDIPCKVFEHDGLRLFLKPIPKKPEYRGKRQKSIIIQSSYEGFLVKSHYDIYRTIQKKARSYQTANRPYILIVNCLGELADQEEIYSAIFGDNGVWGSNSINQYTRLSGILTLHHFLPWTMSVTTAKLFHNPFAAAPYNGVLTRLPQVTTSGECDGVHLRDLLNIDDGWPFK